MSTRCNIKILERFDSIPIWIYHHHDGYMEGVGADLNNRLANRRNWYAADIANQLVKDTKDEYEITTSQHGDIEYLYVIYCENKIMEVWTERYIENSYCEDGVEISWVKIAKIDYKKISEQI